MRTIQSPSPIQNDVIPGATTLEIGTPTLSESDAHLQHKPRVNEQLCAEVNKVVAEQVGTDPMQVNWVSAFLVWHTLAPVRPDSSVRIAKKVWRELFVMAMEVNLFAPRHMSQQFVKRFLSRMEGRNLSRASMRVRLATLMEIFTTLVKVGMAEDQLLQPIQSELLKFSVSAG